MELKYILKEKFEEQEHRTRDLQSGVSRLLYGVLTYYKSEQH